MILVDMNQISLASVMMHLNITKRDSVEGGMVRHMILNSLRMYRERFFKEYGELVICYDSKHYWRRDIFPQYKAGRKKTRDSSSHDWNDIFEFLNAFKDEMIEFMPYKVLEVYGAEADDIIGALTVEMSDFGGEDVVIISADKDFIQLQQYGHVIQWSPMFNKMIKEDNPRRYLFEHLLKGDAGDGVPNANSHDDVFTTGSRQTPMTQKQIDKYWDNRDDLEMIMKPNVYRNFMRNVQMIDLTNTPDGIREAAINMYENYKYPPRGNILTYLIEHRMKMLIDNASEF